LHNGASYLRTFSHRRKLLDEERLLRPHGRPAGAAIASKEPTHERVLRWRLESGRRVAACDRGEPPLQRWQRKSDGPGREAGRRAAALRLEGIEVERGSAGPPGASRAVAAAECREVGPVVGVCAFRRRRAVRRRKVVLNGSGELRKDVSAHLERLDRCQVVAAKPF